MNLAVLVNVLKTTQNNNTNDLHINVKSTKKDNDSH